MSRAERRNAWRQMARVGTGNARRLPIWAIAGNIAASARFPRYVPTADRSRYPGDRLRAIRKNHR